MILSDRTIREELAAGRIVIEPLGDECVQPSSVDLHLDRFFRVFVNHHTPVIDVKKRQDDLTQLVEIQPDDMFVLHPGEFVLGSTSERVALPDDLVARLEGKALAVDTPIPTESGWRTMGDLAVGDRVFDAVGVPTAVVRATDVLTQRPCRRVIFSDGSELIADLSHEWLVATKADRRQRTRARVHAPRTRVVTTADLEKRLRFGSEYNFQVPVCGPVAYRTKQLPIDPYVFGIWVGDGTSTKAEVTTVDDEILQEIRKAGYDVRPASSPLSYRVGGTGHTRDAATGQYARNDSLSSTLRNAGLLGNKHIPADYLQGDIAQRVALLQGLMDSDGYVDKRGRCDFTSVREHIADAFVELAASLGLRPRR